MRIHDPHPVRTAIFPVLILLTVALGCVHEPSWEKTFHKEVVGKTNQQDVLERLGKPQLQAALPEGGSVWVYEYSRGRVNEDLFECWEYVLKFDDNQVLREKEEIDCAKGTASEHSSE